MRDQYGREIHYLRMSLTERCNLKCIYCRGENEYCKGADELKTDQYKLLLQCFAELGINKVRLTGGEPLIRKDLEEIVAFAASCEGIREICMTSNGISLEQRLPGLKKAGLNRINISLDTLDPDCYREITRGGDLKAVLHSIEMAQSLEIPVKINAVIVRGRNEDAIDSLIGLAKREAIDVRFIELMPFGELGEQGDLRVMNSEILAMYPELQPIPSRYPAQPSMDYRAEGFAGRVGFISPVSHKFCSVCNRVRLTSDGKLRMCLGNNGETDLRPVMNDPDALRKLMKKTIFNKPECHAFEEVYHASRRMNQIGG